MAILFLPPELAPAHLKGAVRPPGGNPPTSLPNQSADQLVNYRSRLLAHRLGRRLQALSNARWGCGIEDWERSQQKHKPFAHFNPFVQEFLAALVEEPNPVSGKAIQMNSRLTAHRLSRRLHINPPPTGTAQVLPFRAASSSFCSVSESKDPAPQRQPTPSLPPLKSLPELPAASSLSPLRAMDLQILTAWFSRSDIQDINSDIEANLPRLTPEPIWEAESCDFLQEYL